MIKTYNQINVGYLREWFSLPVTQMVIQALLELQIKENNKLVNGTSLNSEQYVIERNLYRLMGTNEIIKKLTDFDTLKENLLRDKVEKENE